MDHKILIKKLDRNRDRRINSERSPTYEALQFFNDRVGGFTAVMYVPHEENYNDMLRKLKSDDVLCDMGAGDLRFPLMASECCKKVYAVEMNPETLSDSLRIIKWCIPRNLIVVCADWRFFPIPQEVTVISCLVNIDTEELPLMIWDINGIRVYHGDSSFQKVKRLSWYDQKRDNGISDDVVSKGSHGLINRDIKRHVGQG